MTEVQFLAAQKLNTDAVKARAVAYEQSNRAKLDGMSEEDLGVLLKLVADAKAAKAK